MSTDFTGDDTDLARRYVVDHEREFVNSTAVEDLKILLLHVRYKERLRWAAILREWSSQASAWSQRAGTPDESRCNAERAMCLSDVADVIEQNNVRPYVRPAEENKP